MFSCQSVTLQQSWVLKCLPVIVSAGPGSGSSPGQQDKVEGAGVAHSRGTRGDCAAYTGVGCEDGRMRGHEDEDEGA